MRRSFLHPTFWILAVGAVLMACAPRSPEEINIGFIGPLTGNAVDLGLAPSKAIALAIKEYNEAREEGEPKVNFFFEDDQWEGENALPLYDKLRSEHAIAALLISHTDGTVALQEKVLQDGVLLINSLNNDALLASMNENTFVIGKKTEEAAEVVAARIVELGRKKVAGFYVTNSFMTISAEAFSALLERNGVEATMIPVDISKESYEEELSSFAQNGCDALAFFGYKNLGYAMKQGRELGMDAPYFASTTTLGDGYFENSEGAMAGTEFSYFTENDGNYIAARQFIARYRMEYGSPPFSVWPPMQAYDATNILLEALRKSEPQEDEPFIDRMKRSLHAVKYYQGICGNLAILSDGTSRGIYFSLYEVRSKGVTAKVKR